LGSAALALLLSSTASAQDKPTWSFDQNRAWEYLLKQVEFGPRVPGTDAHKACRDWISDEMKKSCDDVHLQELVHHWSVNDKDVHMWNIIGTQNWKDAKSRVLLFAHWDSRPFASQETDPAKKSQPIPGANDGASGVAVLLELMKDIKDKHPGVGIMYLMDDGEDLGPELPEMFLGADYFAKHLPDIKPDYGILLDMIGDSDLDIPVEPNSYARAKKLSRAFYDNAAKLGLSTTFLNTFGPEIEDDHLTLNDHGIPTIDLIDFTYDQWHMLDDTPAHCSPASLKKVGLALGGFVTMSPIFKVTDEK